MYRYFLALRYLLSRPINILGMAGVMVGVWALIVVVSIFSGFLKEVQSHVRAATSDLTILALPWPTSYAEIAPKVEADPNVAACAPRLLWYGLIHALGDGEPARPRVPTIQPPGADLPFLMMLGIEPSLEREVTGFSDWLAAVEDPDLRVDDVDDPLRPAKVKRPDGSEVELPVVLLSERRLRDGTVSKGAIIKVSSAQLHHERGSRGQELSFVDHEFVVAGAYATSHHAFDNMNCFMARDVLRGLMETSHVEDPVTEVIVACVDPDDNDTTAARLKRTVNPLLSRPQAEAFTWQRLNGDILGAVDHQRSLMKLVLLVIMVVAAFLMFATLSMMVTEKTHDIGILSAMGATRVGVLQVFLSCGFAIAVLGALLGVIMGCLTSLYLDPFNTWMRDSFGVDLFPTRIYNLDHVPYDLDPLWIAQVSVMALIFGLVASGVPALRAARHDPLESLRIE